MAAVLTSGRRLFCLEASVVDPPHFNRFLFSNFGVGMYQSRPVAAGDMLMQFAPNFLFPPKFCCTQKNLFQKYNKNKNLSTLKLRFSPQTLKPGCGPVSERTPTILPFEPSLFKARLF